MALFLAAACAAVAVIWKPALEAFMANPALNGVIVGVFLVGVFVCVRQASGLAGDINWVESYRLRGAEGASTSSVRLLAPIASALGDSDRKGALAGTSARALLDGLGSGLDEARELARYLVGLLIFLGLLGTFWGLLETVRSVGDVIDGLAVDAAAADTFGRLQSGLRAPLDGMGTAFSSSLFGLAGALALGFLDLQAGQAQNRFYNEVEDWLSSIARFQAAPTLGDGEGQPTSTSAFVEALLGQTAESLDDLRRLVARSEEGRRETQQALARTGDRLHALAERLEALSVVVERQQHALSQISEREQATLPALQGLTTRIESYSQGDPEARRHLAQIERRLERLDATMSGGQAELTRELRSELRLLGRTLLGRADGPAES